MAGTAQRLDIVRVVGRPAFYDRDDVVGFPQLARPPKGFRPDGPREFRLCRKPGKHSVIQPLQPFSQGSVEIDSLAQSLSV